MKGIAYLGALPSEYTASDDTQALYHFVPKAGSKVWTWCI